MPFGQFFPGAGKRAELGREGNPRQFVFEIVGKLFAIAWVVQQAVDVIEDVPFGDRLVAVLLAEFFECPIGHIF
jgi:hypothetical protein